MNNEQLIKSAHIWALVVFVLFVVIVVATRAESNSARTPTRTATQTPLLPTPMQLARRSP